MTIDEIIELNEAINNILQRNKELVTKCNQLEKEKMAQDDTIHELLKERTELTIKDWNDFIKLVGANKSSCIQAPSNGGYNDPSVGFYEDGSVWVSGVKGCVRLFKKCPYDLMYKMFMQRYEETKK